MRRKCLPLFALSLAACGGDVTLALDLRTDLRAGTELSRVVVERVDRDSGEVIEAREREVDRSLDGAAGFRVAEMDVPVGTTEVRVLLEGPSLDARRGLIVQVDSPTVATVVYPRSCIDVTCPEGQECLGDGRCGSPECTVENPDACGDPVCEGAAECDAPPIACAAPRCDPIGGCSVDLDDAACGADEICDVDRGCVRDPNACEPLAEDCNGVDDDCDRSVDEDACGCAQGERFGHTYLVCDDVIGWSDAQTACADIGYHLASIEDAEENAFVGSTAGAAMPSSTELWIGLNDQTIEGTFVWSDGTPYAFERWVMGQPNDGAAGASEDCGVLSIGAGDDYGWKDADCLTVTRPYVCEVP